MSRLRDAQQLLRDKKQEEEQRRQGGGQGVAAPAVMPTATGLESPGTSRLRQAQQMLRDRQNGADTAGNRAAGDHSPGTAVPSAAAKAATVTQPATRRTNIKPEAAPVATRAGTAAGMDMASSAPMREELPQRVNGSVKPVTALAGTQKGADMVSSTPMREELPQDGSYKPQTQLLEEIEALREAVRRAEESYPYMARTLAYTQDPAQRQKVEAERGRIDRDKTRLSQMEALYNATAQASEQGIGEAKQNMSDARVARPGRLRELAGYQAAREMDGAAAQKVQTMAGSAVEEERAFLDARRAYEDAQLEGRGKVDVPTRLGMMGRSVGLTTAGAPVVAAETAAQTGRNIEAEWGNEERQALTQELMLLYDQLLDAETAYGKDSREAALLRIQVAELEDAIDAARVAQPVDMDSLGMSSLTEAGGLTERALAGLSEGEKLLGRTGQSMAQNALLLPTAIINPAVPLVYMGIIAGADKAHELSGMGKTAGEALVRGTLAGLIETFTEKIPLDNLIDIAQTGGLDSIILNALKQAGSEATEEAVSYIANSLVDMMAGDEALSLGEWLEGLGEATLGGMLSGTGMGAGASGVNYANSHTAPMRVATEDTSSIPPAQTLEDLMPQREARAAPVPAQQSREELLAEWDAQAAGPVEMPTPAAEAAQGPALASQREMTVPARQTAQRADTEEMARRRAQAEELAATLGQDGEASFLTVLEATGADPVSLFQDYARVYNAGTRGAAAGTVDSGGLSVIQKEIAYGAGTRDAETSRVIAAEKAQYAPTHGAGGGIVDSPTSRALDKETRTMLHDYGRMSGTRIEMVEPGSLGEARGNLHKAGMYRDGVLYLDAGAENMPLAVARHEITHHIQAVAPEAYEQYRNAVMELAEFYGEDVSELVQATIERYERAGVSISHEEAMDEIAAEFAGEMLTDRAMADRLIGRDRSLGQKLLDWVREVLASLRKKLGGDAKSSPVVTELQAIEKMWAEAVREAGQKLPPLDTPSENRQGRYAVRDYGIDRDAIQENMRTVAAMAPVASLTGQEFVKSAVKLDAQVAAFFESVGGSVLNPDLGDVALTKSGAEGSIGHGLGRKKSAAFAAVPDVVAKGQIIDAQDNWKGRQYNTYVIAAPIEIDGEAYDMGVVVMRSTNTQRYYLHEVLTQKKDGALPFKTGTNQKASVPGDKVPSKEGDALSFKAGAAESSESGGTPPPSLISLLQQVQDVKGEDGGRYALRRVGTNRVAELERENARLRQQVEGGGQRQVDIGAVHAIALDALDKYQSKYSRTAMTEALDELYTYVASGQDAEGNALTYETLHERTLAIAKDVLSEANVLKDDLWKEHAGMRQYLKETKITLAEQDRADLPDDYKAFSRSLFGKVRLANEGGMPVDQAYAELQEHFGKGFFPDGIDHPADQVVQMRDAVRAVAKVYENPYARNFNEAANLLANELIESFYDAPQETGRYADRLDRALSALERERAFRESKIEKLKAEYAQRRALESEKRTVSGMRTKIRREVERLSKALQKPTEQNYIPAGMRVAVSDFLGSIDMVSARMVELHQSGESRGATLHKLRELQRAMQKIADNPAEAAIEMDPDLLAMMDETYETLKVKSLYELDVNELETLWRTVRSIGAAVASHNKALAEGRKAEISALGTAVMEDLKGKRGKNYKASAIAPAQGFRDMTQINMLDAFSMFEQLGPTAQGMLEGLREGFNGKINMTEETRRYMEKLLGEAKITPWSGKRAKSQSFTVYGGRLELTPAQVMELYVLWGRPQAKEHILEGGVKPAPQVVSRGKGKLPKVTESYERVRVSEGDVQHIIATLTPEQKRIADGMQRFLAQNTSRWGNKVTRALYGYDKFGEPHYWPIVSDKNYLNQVYGQPNETTLKNMGFTKALVEHANNPIVLGDAFDTFARHADQMASFAAFVQPLSDVQRVMNYKTEDGSVRQSIEKKYGARANTFVGQLITDINGGARVDSGTVPLLHTSLGKYKAAKVAANVRVIVQQPTAYLRASAMIDPKYLIQGIHKKADYDLMNQYAPIARWKDWGFYEMDTGRSMKNIMLGEKRITDTLMAPAGWADRVTWGKLWNAVVAETKDIRAELEPGSVAFNEAVGKRFSEIIDRTQVVDSVFHRSQMMRDKDGLAKLTTSFMAEPIKSYNMLRSAMVANAEQGTKESKARLVRTLAAWLVTVTVNNMVTALMDAYRDDEEEEKFGTRWLKSLAASMVEEPFGMVPYLRDVASVVQGYDVKRADMQGLSDAVDAVMRVGSDKYTPWYKIQDVAKKAADLTGLPASSLIREVSAFVNAITRGTDSRYARYVVDKTLYAIDYPSNKGIFYDDLYAAWKLEDKADYKKIHADMLENGFTEDDMAAAIRARVKKTAEFEALHGETVAEVQSLLNHAERYEQLSEDYQQKAQDYADQYGTVAAYKKEIPEYEVPSIYSWTEKADAGASVGLDIWEYILYKVAMDAAREDGSLKQEEVVTALTGMGWLSDKEKSYLFGTQYDSDKNNPWK